MRLLVFFLKIVFFLKPAMPVEKMLIFYGTIDKFNVNPLINMDLNSCVRIVSDFSTVILASWNSSENCHLFGFDQILDQILEIKTNEGDMGQYLILKSDQPNSTCPAFPETDIRRPVNESWSKTENGWTTRLCKNGWMLFSRPDSIFVCMKFIQLERGATREVALQTCIDNGAIMTGLATRSEVDWLNKFVVAPLQTGEWDGIWINGMRDCSANTNKTCQNFVWSDGYTTDTELLLSGILWDPGYDTQQQDCLTVYNAYSDTKLNLVSCTEYNLAIGVACGYKFE
ncbi:C-type lectin domain-containing protein [Caenorhabditis elegans]|uniref:C-type lectin domain-containing protein n=1 Tax=Caenorhabditis elegans TaxID=6239 RepID=Q9U2V0_CAEEL|nr:C-type lectin domain-containing protein [Caenorhabditis elegans]CAB55127.2 C-type lectin domain-containing protein [Caenorhabditis elegans]|eukprot:NP_503021.2 C-type LECtin [Caenorhabditis elegans]